MTACFNSGRNDIASYLDTRQPVEEHLPSSATSGTSDAGTSYCAPFAVSTARPWLASAGAVHDIAHAAARCAVRRSSLLHYNGP